MKDMKIPELLTPEMVKALTENAHALKDIVTINDEATVNSIPNSCDDKVFAPRLVKITNILCNVWIENENAVELDK